MSSSSLPTGLDRVTLIAHADWSKNPSKRWMAVALWSNDRRWTVIELSPVLHAPDLFSHLRSRQLTPGCILAGFDFPIGLPSHFAEKAGITNFIEALHAFGQGDWSQFYIPAESSSQVSLHRPFYPSRPGGSCRHDLEQGLDIPFDQLYRLCEMRHENRHAACPLFWTLGAQQVGKAAISAWQELLAPALAHPAFHLQIWPFSGSLSRVCQTGNIVVAETYPAEFYHHLGLSFTSPRRSKRNLADRLSFSDHLLAWAGDQGVQLDPSVRQSIKQGFGTDPSAEDRFDALVGLYGMINVVLGQHPSGEPLPLRVRRVEGWIFGQVGPESLTAKGA